MANAFGGEHDERLAADGEHGRHGVDGEDHVGRLDEHEHGEQRGGDPLGVDAGEQLLAVVLVGRRHDPADEPHRDVVVVVDLLVLVVAGDLDGGVEQERTEDVEDPFEVLDERHAGEDEDGAHHEGAEDAPEQHAELVLARHGEEREDHRPDEDVVDRQALLDQEAGVVLAAGLAALPRRVSPSRTARPIEIQTADSMAASLIVMTWAVRCTSNRSAMSIAVITATSATHAHTGHVERGEVLVATPVGGDEGGWGHGS